MSVTVQINGMGVIINYPCSFTYNLGYLVLQAVAKRLHFYVDSKKCQANNMGVMQEYVSLNDSMNESRKKRARELEEVRRKRDMVQVGQIQLFESFLFPSVCCLPISPQKYIMSLRF